jgi:hypothetical protein
MINRKLADIAGTAILAIGAFFAFFPHAFHAKAGLVEDTHIKHVIYGIALLVLGLGVLIYGNRAFAKK